MQFQVPQFIEVEDKLFGPLTLRQFIYLAGGIGLSYIAYAFLPFFVAIIAIVIIGGFALLLAFYKQNERPFINFVESAFKYSLRGRMYVWRKEDKQVSEKDMLPKKEGPKIAVPKLSEGKLKELAEQLDIQDTGVRPM